MTEPRRLTRPLRPRPLRLVMVPLAIVVAFYVGVGLWIGSGVHDVARAAQTRFAGAPVAALCALVADENAGYDLRNRAVWALGQLGDPDALPVLESLYRASSSRGTTCQHDRAICQHELRKAIAGCRGAVNVTAVVWRRGFARDT